MCDFYESQYDEGRIRGKEKHHDMHFQLCEGSLLLQELLSENHMEVVEFFSSFPRDKRVFFYAISMPNACKTLCICLRSLKNDRTVTVSNSVLLNSLHGAHVHSDPKFTLL